MTEKIIITDMIGEERVLPVHPRRIISLVPSQTEFLVDIGAPVVGRTKFCIHPAEKVGEIGVIGGTKNFRFEKIKELQPDLIIGNKEENYQEGIEQLAQDYPVWISDVRSLEDAFLMMENLAGISGREKESAPIISDCRTAIKSVRGTCNGRVIYLIWKNPWMAAGKDTFISHMLSHLGFENAIHTNRYPEMTEQEICELDSDYILFSSEPFPFKEDALAYAKKHWPGAEATLVDGELYSWYGSRMKKWLNVEIPKR